MAKTEKIGIYGGTFAPVHKGHINAALSFLKCFNLDKLLIIPTFIPPHKKLDFEDSPEDRLNMLNLAFSELNSDGCEIIVSDYEISKGGISYTKDTVEHFKNKDNELYFLCGTDMFLTIDYWYMPEIIFSNATVVLAKRENGCEDIDDAIENKAQYLINKFNAQIEFIDYTPYEISSSQIRLMIKNGISNVNQFLPENVYKYIEEKKLYRI